MFDLKIVLKIIFLNAKYLTLFNGICIGLVGRIKSVVACSSGMLWG